MCQSKYVLLIHQELFSRAPLQAATIDIELTLKKMWFIRNGALFLVKVRI